MELNLKRIRKLAAKMENDPTIPDMTLTQARAVLTLMGTPTRDAEDASWGEPSWH